MFYLSFLKYLLNPKVLLGIAISGLVAYHFYEVSSLQSEIITYKTNYQKTKNALYTSNSTIDSLTLDITNLKETRVISEDSYIKEVKRLKEVINNIEPKIVYKDKIVVKRIKVPVKVKGKTVYIEKCQDIQIKKADSTDSNNSIIKIMGTIGQ